MRLGWSAGWGGVGQGVENEAFVVPSELCVTLNTPDALVAAGKVELLHIASRPAVYL